MPYLKTLEIIMTDSECFVQSQGVTRCSPAVGNRLSVYDSVILGGFLLGHTTHITWYMGSYTISTRAKVTEPRGSVAQAWCFQ